MGYILYGISYIINHQIFKKHTPLICGLVITNNCNLHCRHCRIASRGDKSISFTKVIEAIDSFYNEGGRTLYLEGGEPFIWRDGEYGLEDIIVYSHKKGFLSTIIYTNGTFPIETSANTVFVSIDGLQKTHDLIRGETFNLVMKNVRESKHPALYANYTINNYNKADIEDFCKFLDNIEQLKGVFFYFHTPYYGLDELYIDQEERNRIIRYLLKIKNKYKILNSKAGLKSALRNDWKRPLDICRVYEDGKMYQCCRFPGDAELCRNCGYLSYAEIDQTFKLKPTAIMSALKYF